MGERQKISYEIQYTKIADKFFQTHEDVREQYKAAIKELLTGDHPEIPDTSKTLGEIGYSGGEGATPKFGLVLSKITIPAGATSFSAKHGDIGYSLIVSRVRLVEIKAAA